VGYLTAFDPQIYILLSQRQMAAVCLQMMSLNERECNILGFHGGEY
jgi:hypothetical protein